MMYIKGTRASRLHFLSINRCERDARVPKNDPFVIVQSISLAIVAAATDRLRLWKAELQQFANRTGLVVHIIRSEKLG
jgi:hypothetical protein